MKTIYLGLCLVLLLLTGLQLSSATAQTTKGGDPQAKALLDKLSQKYKAYKTLKLNFLLSISHPDRKINEKQSGKVCIKSNKYRISTNELERISDGKSVWTYFIKDEEVQVNNVDPKSGEISPADFFSFYNRDFDCYISSETATAYEIDLTPVNKQVSYFKVRIMADKKNNTITKATVFEKNGMRYTYNFSNLQPNTDIEDAQFYFNKSKYPNVEIIDLR